MRDPQTHEGERGEGGEHGRPTSILEQQARGKDGHEGQAELPEIAAGHSQGVPVQHAAALAIERVGQRITEVVPAPQEIREAQGQKEGGKHGHDLAAASTALAVRTTASRKNAPRNTPSGRARPMTRAARASASAGVRSRSFSAWPARHAHHQPTAVARANSGRAVAGGYVTKPRPDEQERGRYEGQSARRTEERRAPAVHEHDGRRVRQEAEALGGPFERHRQRMEAGDQRHEQEVGGPVDGRLSHVPDDAVARREVVGVPQQDRRVFLRPSAEVDEGRSVGAQSGEKEKDAGEIEPVESGPALRGGRAQGAASIEGPPNDRKVGGARPAPSKSGEEGRDVACEQVGLFRRSEVAARGHERPSRNVVKTLGPFARRLALGNEMVGEDRDRGRHLHEVVGTDGGGEQRLSK